MIDQFKLAEEATLDDALRFLDREGIRSRDLTELICLKDKSQLAYYGREKIYEYLNLNDYVMIGRILATIGNIDADAKEALAYDGAMTYGDAMSGLHFEGACRIAREVYGKDSPEFEDANEGYAEELDGIQTIRLPTDYSAWLKIQR